MKTPDGSLPTENFPDGSAHIFLPLLLLQTFLSWRWFSVPRDGQLGGKSGSGPHTASSTSNSLPSCWVCLSQPAP